MTAPLAWPSALAGTPTVAVLERAIERERLSHSLLLHGENLGTLAYVAHAIADRLLNRGAFAGGALGPDQGESRPKAAPTVEPSQQHFPVKHHPDFFSLRPSGKARDIKIGKADAPEENTMRDFISRLSLSPTIARRKVGIVYEADRMNASTSNAFLKTLEEPPGRSTLILLTTRPYALLPTIRSRCLHFRFTDASHEALADSEPALQEKWKSVLAGYAAWLGQLAEGVTEKRAVSNQVLGVYGLVTRFQAVLTAATDQVWKEQKEKLPAELDDDEVAAIQTGIANGLRLKLFSEIEHATRDFGMKQLSASADAPETVRRALASAITQLEHDVGLLRLNLNEGAVLEHFLLSSLRIWAKR